MMLKVRCQASPYEFFYPYSLQSRIAVLVLQPSCNNIYFFPCEHCDVVDFFLALPKVVSIYCSIVLVTKKKYYITENCFNILSL